MPEPTEPTAPSDIDEDVEDVIAERPDDDDYDLLTFGEAGARLTEEITKQQRRIDALRASGGDVGAAEARLAALQEAQRRNEKPTIEDMHRSGFFGSRD